MHCMMGLSKVSELRASEGNNGNSGGLEGSGSSYLNVVVTHLGALAPFSGILLLWLALAIFTIVELDVDTGLSIAGNDFGESFIINLFGNIVENNLLVFDISISFNFSVVKLQGGLEVSACIACIWNLSLKDFVESIFIIDKILG